MSYSIITRPSVMKAWLGNIDLDPDKYYELNVTEPRGGSGKQNRTFHGLLTEFIPYMSYEDWDEARESVLMKYGPTKEGTINGLTFMVCPSWAKCKKDERGKIITGLIDEMLEAGVNGKIFDGLVAEWKSYEF